MYEVKIYGRGGQGVVTAGDIIASCVVHEGGYAHSIPSFGPERRGGPSTSSLRISTEPILLRCDVRKPDIICIMDRTIWRYLNVLSGLKENSIIIINSNEAPKEMKGYKIYMVEADNIAGEILGKPIPNTVMVGAFSRVTGLIKMESVKITLHDYFNDWEKNIKCAENGYNEVREYGN